MSSQIIASQKNSFLTKKFQLWLLIPLMIDALSVVLVRNYQLVSQDFYLLGYLSRELTIISWMIFLLGWLITFVFNLIFNKILVDRLFNVTIERIVSFVLAYIHAFLLIYFYFRQATAMGMVAYISFMMAIDVPVAIIVLIIHLFKKKSKNI